MFRTWFQGWQQGKFRCAKSLRGQRWKFRPALENLEARDVPSFAALASYTIGTQPDGFVPNAVPQDVVTGDFNGDGKLDMVVAHSADNSVYFLAGNGDGTFKPAVQIPVGESIQGSVYAADFNGDGKLDLFLPSGDLTHPIILLGNGDGTFKPRIDSSSYSVSGTYARGWAVGDFNGDGKMDIVSGLVSTTVGDTGGYTVLLGNGDGTFKAGIVGPMDLHYTRWVTVGDVNADGKLDLAFADGQGTNSQPGSSELSIMLGNGDGTFRFGGHYASPATPNPAEPNVVSNPEDVFLVDLNHDGKLDAVVSDYDHNINVFLGNGDGTFQQAVGYDPGNYPRDVQFADVNGDGKLDMIVTNAGVGQGGARFALTGEDEPGSLAVFLGNGDGTFQPNPIQFGPDALPNWTAVGDFNGDGFPDLAITQALDGHSVFVMLDQPANPNLPPTEVNAPSAAPSTVSGTTTNLSVLGADDGGEANLTYTWSVLGPAPVVFGADNGTNAGKNITVTFTKSGGYSFRAAITDANGLSFWDIVDVNVNQTLTSITVGPASASVVANGTQQFTATAKDQFGATLATQTAFTWTVSGGGTISNTGLFTAGASGGGPFAVTATSGGKSGSAGVSVTGGSTNAPPTVATPASATSNPVAANTTNLSVLGADDGGEANLTYTWATTGSPPAAATFSANGTNAAKNSKATFTVAGSYNFQVTITDAGGLTATSSVNVTVNQTLTTIVVAPAFASINVGSRQAFSATGKDQFGNVLSSQPSFTWSVAGLGSINSSGLYSAPSSGTGPATVTASSSGVNGTAGVTVIASSPPGTDIWTGLGATTNWSDAANWNTDLAPGAATTVIFNGTSSKNAVVDARFAGTVAAVQINSGYVGTVSLSENLTVTGAFSEGAGSFNAGSNTLFEAGNLTVSGGTFNASTGTVTFDQSGGIAATVTVSAAGVNFNNVIVAQTNPSSGVNQLAITGTLTVNGTFTYAGGTWTDISSGTIACAGNLDDQKFGWTGSPVFVIDGAGNQTIEDTAPAGSGMGYEGLVRNITINKPSGTLFLATDLTVYGSFTLTAGTVNTGSYMWLLGNSALGITDTSGGNVGNIELFGSRAVTSPSMQVANITFASASASLTAPSGSLSVSGNWNNSAGGTFILSGGTVVFNGTGAAQQLTSGGKAFNNLTIAAGSILQLEDNLVVLGVLTNLGTLNANGHTVTIG